MQIEDFQTDRDRYYHLYNSIIKSNRDLRDEVTSLNYEILDLNSKITLYITNREILQSEIESLTASLSEQQTIHEFYKQESEAFQEELTKTDEKFISTVRVFMINYALDKNLMIKTLDAKVKKLETKLLERKQSLDLSYAL